MLWNGIWNEHLCLNLDKLLLSFNFSTDMKLFHNIILRLVNYIRRSFEGFWIIIKSKNGLVNSNE